MSSASFNLVYDGPALENNEMAARDLSSSILAADTLFSEAAAILNGDRSESRLVVKASFRTGSFGIDYTSAVALADRLKDMFAGAEASAISNADTIFRLLLGTGASVFGLVKWLRRRKIEKIEVNGNRVRVIVADDHLDVERRVLELYRSYKLRQALEDLVAAPLRKEGIEGFAVIREQEITATADKPEADYFVAEIGPEERLEESTRETRLNIVSPAFHAGDKWRVNEGQGNFYAAIVDEEFTGKVQRNEVEFGVATQLKVLLREVQYTDTKGVLRKDSEIVKVLEVKKPATQPELQFPPAQRLIRYEEGEE